MAELTDLSDLDQAHAYRIHRVSRLLRRSLLAALAEVSPQPISPEQYFLLFRLSAADGQIQGDLVDPALDDRPNISRQIDALAKRGLLERRRDDADRRRWRVFLTAEGRALMDRFRPRILAQRQALFGDLPPETLDALDAVLDHLTAKLE